MKCVICKHGTTQVGEGTLLFERDGKTYVVRHVPAEICSNCGEEYFSDAVAAQLEDSLELHTAPDIPAETRSYISSSIQPIAF